MPEFLTSAKELLETVRAETDRQDGENTLRDALHTLSTAKHLADLMDDHHTSAEAHELIHSIGQDLRSRFGCFLAPYRGEYWLNCGAYNAHHAFGQSKEAVCDVMCSLCDSSAESVPAPRRRDLRWHSLPIRLRRSRVMGGRLPSSTRHSDVTILRFPMDTPFGSFASTLAPIGRPV